MACDICGSCCSDNTVWVGNSYIRLCDKCLDEHGHRSLKEIVDNPIEAEEDK